MTLYEVLGASSDASDDDLRRAYRAAARELHPDLNPGTETSDAMRRLNAAWAVLGNPDRRREYDAAAALVRTAGTRPAYSTPIPDLGAASAGDHPLARLFRPSVVIVVILALIFIVTAYAAPSQPGRPTVPATTPVTTPLPAAPADAGPAAGSGSTILPLVGGCILPLMGYDAVVTCNQPGARMVTAAVANGSQCPAGNTVYQLEGRSQLVCLAAGGP